MNDLVRPKSEMSTDDFLDSLDQSNGAIRTVRETFARWQNGVMAIYRKDSSLYENVMGRISLSRLPIIDKPLQIVVEARDYHEKLTGALFAYHYARKEPPNNDPNLYSDRIWGEMYLKAGYGYYFTGAYGRTGHVVIDDIYRPDRYDKDLLIAHNISR